MRTLESIFRHLLDEKLTTIKELEQLTGRGSSTIYRWINGESQPHFEDVRRLVRGLGKPEARRRVVGLMASDLPVVINWLEDKGVAEDEVGERHDGHDVLERTLLALDCVTHVLNEAHEAIRRQELTEETYASLVRFMDDAIRHLTSSRTLLQRYRVPAP